MAEFVAVVRDEPREYNVRPDGAIVKAACSVILGVRVDNGQTVMDSNPESKQGKVYERHWGGMPDDLAFATEAFYTAIFKERQIPNGHYYECHVYQRFALGYSKSPTLQKGTQVAPVDPTELPTPPILVGPYRGFGLYRHPRADKQVSVGWVHSLISLPHRTFRSLLNPESIGVEGVDGKMIISDIGCLSKVYDADGLYRVRGTKL